jgi:Tol biopolymer transport system component
LTLYFTSDREGDNDLWGTSRPNLGSPFASPQNLGSVNSAGSDLDPALTPDGLELFFSSDRSGSQQLWRSLRTCR